MSLPKYPEYKDSGVSWLGEVPAHWRIVRLQDIAEVFNGYPFDSKFFDEYSGYHLIRIRDMDSATTATKYNGEYVKAAEVTSNDVLIGMDGDFNVGRWRGAEPALLNQRMCCVRTGDLALSIFVRNGLSIPLKAINDVTYSTTVKHLSSLDVEKIKFALPERGELLSIATFLDRETAKIDALIAEQEKLIALLAEKRQATISRAVTRGLDPNVPLKDSGVPWLGKVPAHWRVARLSYFARVENGTTPSRAIQEYWDNGDVPWLASGEVNQFYIESSSEFITKKALNECSLRLLPVGTIVIGMVGQGKTRGLPGMLKLPAAINQNLAAISLGSSLDSDYVLFVMLAAYEWIRESGRGGNQAAMNCEIISALRIPVPAIDEQRNVAHFIKVEIERLDTLRQRADSAITLLKERRAALISAAVTGKIDVRGLAA
jgi:type I restriction enzyme S subunit